jgi:2-oxoisovalerate dehydrogenase E1 component
MGVHWALNASKDFKEKVEIVDLRTLYPLDEETILKSVKKAKKCLVVTEEPVGNSFARSLAGMIQEKCFRHLDAPVMVIGSENMPAIPLNSTLEQTMIPSMEKVKAKMLELFEY